MELTLLCFIFLVPDGPVRSKILSGARPKKNIRHDGEQRVRKLGLWSFINDNSDDENGRVKGKLCTIVVAVEKTKWK